MCGGVFLFDYFFLPFSVFDFLRTWLLFMHDFVWFEGGVIFALVVRPLVR